MLIFPCEIVRNGLNLAWQQWKFANGREPDCDSRHAAQCMNQVIDQASTSVQGRAITAGILLFLALAGIALVTLALRWPFTEQSIVDALEERSARSVEITGFRQTYFPPGCIAEGIRFLHREHKDKPPLITIRKLVIRGSYLGLFRSPTKIDEARAIGLHITIPPRRYDGQRPEVIPLTVRQSGKSVLISQITADQALLEFRGADPGDQTFVVQIHQLALSHVGDKDQFTYRTALSISKPPGEIHATGTFGPWNENDPARTAVSGSYTYTNANLGVFDKLAGTLCSKGSFQGTLAHLRTDGEAHVLNLRIDDARHRVPLRTTFHAVVNGTNGDTYLQSIYAHAWKTNSIFVGSISGNPDSKGKTAVFDFSVRDGRIEDLFRMFVRAIHPPVSGSVNLRCRVRVPEGPGPFLRRLEIRGDFGISGEEFRNPETQSSIDRLGKSAQGETKTELDDDPDRVLSNLVGHVVVRDGVATFTNISFGIPGASAELHGTFGLISKTVELHGKLRTTGSPADATSGFKSFLLRVLTPFLKKKPAVTVLPFQITGTYDHISVGLDFGSR